MTTHKETSTLPSLHTYANKAMLAKTACATRTEQALQWLTEQPCSPAHWDMAFFDRCILAVEEKIQKQLNQLLQNSHWKAFESSWMSLAYLLDSIPEGANIQIDVLDASKAALQQHDDEAVTLHDSPLHQLIYQQEYDTPGGTPYAALITNYTVTASEKDMAWLSRLASLGESAHCPCLLNVDANFFKQKAWHELHHIQPLATLFEHTDYLAFHALRAQADARYIALCLPQFLLRAPYGEPNPTPSHFQEMGLGHNAPGLWGKAAFALARCMVKSFHNHGWGVHIQGPQSGGLIQNLTLLHFDNGDGPNILPPIDMIIPENMECQLAEAGFIPLCYYKNSRQACFFSANSIQKALVYDKDQATANSRVNTQLPYIMLTSRIAHYLKVLQRENIGSCKDALTLEKELNRWLQRYVTRMNHPDAHTIARHPLKQAHVTVRCVDDRPGFYRVALEVCPHWHMEGMEIALACVSWLPQSKN